MSRTDAELGGEGHGKVPASFVQRVIGLKRWSGLTLFIYAAALLAGTHFPNPSALLPIETNDKWLHFGAYFGLVFLAAAWRSNKGAVTWRSTLGTWSAAALLGALDEVTQKLPGINRSAEVADWTADVCGAAVGLLVWHLVRRTIARDLRPVD